MKNIEDLYPLSPLQQGMLFHSLLAPESAAYVTQTSWTLRGTVDGERLRQSWQAAVDRHPVLRTSFLWEGLEEPIQAVRRKATLPWREEDWRGLPEAERQERLAALRAEERRPFDLTRAPLLRLALVRTADDVWEHVWTIHHLLLDGWSMSLLFQELLALYHAAREGREPVLPPVRPFRSYIAWLKKQDLAKAEAFWRRTLAGFTAPTVLGIDAAAPARRGEGYAEERVWLPDEVAAGVQALAARSRVTLNTVTLAAWAALLARTSGEEDVVFGSVVSGRPAHLPGVEAILGPLINTLPVRAQPAGEEPLIPWLQKLQAWQLELRQLEHTPLMQVQQWSEVPPGTPLFESLFVFENYPRAEAAAAGIDLGFQVADVQSVDRTTYPLTLTLVVSGGIRLELSWDQRRFEAAAVRRVLGHLQTLLAGAAADPERRIGELPLLSRAEREEILIGWGTRPAPYGWEECIHHLFARQAAATPEAVAVAFEGRHMTYGELDERSNRLARFLRRLGVGPEARVGLFMHKWLELPVAILGVLKAGGCYVPLGADAGSDRLEYMLEAAGAGLVLTHEAAAGDLPATAARVVRLDTEWPEIAREDGAPLDPSAVGVAPDNLAYVIFTSGSTGRPKGAMIEHRSLVNAYRAWEVDYGLRGLTSHLQMASFSFDVFTGDFVRALCSGGKLVLVPRERLLDPVGLLDLMAAEAVDCAEFVPAVVRGVMEVLEARGERLERHRLMAVGSDTWYVGEILALRRLCGPQTRVVNSYGITETTIDSTFLESWEGMERELEVAQLVPIGRPFPATEIYLLDRHLAPVPAGVAGEMLIGGPGVGRGYVGSAEQTATRFVPHPFSPEPGARLYRSGDLARWRPDGLLQFLGRADTQIKVRGYRIELGEIESVLSSHPAVSKVAVLARGQGTDRTLVACVVPKEGEGTDLPARLRAHLRSALPEYMVPSAFVVLDAFPLTPNGKVDRKALARIEPERQDDGPASVPRTPMEEVVAGIWADLLKVERVGPRSNFFELGGHSLLATRLASRLRETLGVELPLRAVFDAPTVAELAARAEAALGQGIAARPPLTAKGAARGPLSFAQERLWFLERLEPGSAAWHIPAALRLRGDLDPAALERTFAEIVRRHEALRTVFREEGGEPWQVVLPAAGWTLSVEDLRDLEPATREAEASRRLRDEAVRPLDLEEGPLFRVRLLRLADDDWALSAVLHHAVSDGWSTGLLVREIAALYPAFRQGLASPLPELPVQYLDFALWQRDWLRGEVLDEQIGWWRGELSGVPAVLDLPADRPRPAVESHRGAVERLALAAPLVEKIGALARRAGATPFMVLLAAFQTVLHRSGAQEDVPVGTPVANRPQSELEDLIGFFVNTLVLRGRLDGPELTFKGLLERTRKTALGAFARQDVPFERLVEALAVERSLAHAPLFQVMLVLENTPSGSLELPGLTLEALGAETGTAKVDLTLWLAEAGGEIGGFLEYAADLFDAATARRMLGHLQILLEGAVADPARRIADLPLLTGAETAQIAAWNDTAAVHPESGQSLPELLAAQARRTPDAVALVCRGACLTYGELDARAAVLAARLRALGVGPEVLVGLCAERSLEMMVGLLAILRAGGAYVPLDPAFPVERLALMVEDAALPVLLTQEDLVGRLPGHRARVLLLDGVAEPLEEAGIEPVPVPAEALAYVLFTSGSTGRPKGVQIPHGALVNFLLSMRRAPGLAADDTLVAVTTLSFDIAGLELFLPLLVGARVVVATREEAADAGLLGDLLAASRATALQATPATWRLLLDAGWTGRDGLTALCGGEALPGELAARLRPRVRALWNLYGPTETTIWSAAGRVEETPADAAGLPLGQPLDNTRLYLADPGFALVPAGVAGELCIGGAGLSRGYLGRPDLTAERFVPDPFSGEAGARLCRTGDLARRRADGTLDFLGRLDHQVKVRGFRIELAEIEAALATHPRVRQAVVLAQGTAAERELMAWLVLSDAADAGLAAELRNHLRATLPEYMVPPRFVVLDAFPLTPNGKVDRKALGRVPQAGLPAAAAEASAPPATPLEELVAGIWADLLGRERVGTRDHFFDLGGHSLLGTRLVARLRDALGVDLPLRALFEAPTLAAFASRVESALRQGATPLPPLTARGAVRGPLSFSQERLWFLEQLAPGSAAWHIPAALRLSGDLEAEALRRALEEIVHRHEALRTAFAAGEDGAAVQIVTPAPPFDLPVADLRGLPMDERLTEARRRIELESRQPFDLTGGGPLVRALLLRLDEREHALCVVLHHLAGDGWSVGVLVRETAALYEAFRQGGPSPLPALPVQYLDYAVWQRDWLRGEVLDAQLAWWRGELEGAPGYLELPTDRPRPPVESHRGAAAPASLPAETAAGVRALARSTGTTPFMVLLAAFQAVIHRLTGQDDVLVGTPVANRTRVEVEDLIGLFVNTLVLRGRPGTAGTFDRHLTAVRAAALGAFAHQDLPFERLVEELAVERSLAHSPLFQTMLVLQNAPEPALELPGLTLAPLAAGTGTAQFDLTLTWSEVEAGLAGSLDYATDLFDAATAHRFLAHFQTLLEGAVADPARRLADLPLLTAAEQAELAAWNATDTVYPEGEALLSDLLVAQAKRTPDAVAVTFESASLTYRELAERSEALAAHLRTLGVGPEVLVGICADRSLELMVGLLAILRAGGAYVPLEPGAPAERLTAVLADADVPVLLVQEKHREHLPVSRAVTVLLDGSTPLRPAGTAISSPGYQAGTSLAYAIFTSGSTGRPKGALNSHRGIVNRLLWMQSAYGLATDDRVLQKTPIGFDVSVWELFWPLLAGARLVLARPEGHRDPLYLQETIRREGITTLHFVPSMLQAFLDEKAGLDALRAAGTLRRVICSGEALPAELAARFAARLGGPGGAELYNLYGPTETAVEVTFHACQGGEERIPIGRPVANTRIHVVDREGLPLPVGAPGELCIGGVQVGRGYLRRPDLTAERFVPDPFGLPSGQPGSRLYRTGDLVRRLPDGAIEYLGRIDFQVKIRGFRIEPGEIEAALYRHPAVREAAVLAVEERGERRLVAWVVADGEPGALKPELRRHARAWLPEPMVPAAFVFLESLPLSANGKLDRRALAALRPAAPRAEILAPRTPVEEVLAALWSDLLGIERVGSGDSFFDLGGHSLLATRLLSRVREAFGVELPLRTLFEAPALAGFAARVEEEMEKGWGADTPARPPLAAVGADRGPLSFAQERLWFLAQLEPESPAYHIPLVLRLRGALDVPALAAALGEIVRRHEALRTVFRDETGAPRQVVLPAAGWTLPVADLRDLAPAERERALESRLGDEVRRPFDLAQGPLFRALLLRLTDDEQVLAAVLHHVISDGWSTGVLLREAATLYDAFQAGRPLPLPELPVQYLDYALWQRAWLQGEVLDGQLAWWREELQGAPAALELPADRPRPPVESHRGAAEPVALETGLTAAIAALARRTGTTPFMVLLAAFQALLHRYGGQDDVLVGTPVTNRPRVELEGLIGLFVNTLVLRGRFAPAPTFRSLLDQTRRTALGAFAHQDLPFERLVDALGVERSLAHSPLFQVMLVHEAAPPAAPLAVPGLTLEPVAAEPGAARFDLTLWWTEADGRLQGLLEYATDLFDAATARRLLGHLRLLLEGATADPAARVLDLPLLSAAEQAQIAAWNDTAAALPGRGALLHELVLDQARRAPGAVAVTFEGAALTYGELDERSAALAAHLRALGVGPETLVGICAERSLELPIGLLGILRAGGAWLPLEPALPAERLAFVLEDAGAPVLLVQEPLLGRLPAHEAAIVLLDRPESWTPQVKPAEGTPGDAALAYAIFTSGSTGRPKGVLNSHRGIVNRLLWGQSAHPLTAADRVLQKTPIGFDVSVWELFAPLAAGARLVLARPEGHRDPHYLAEILRREQITVAHFVPSLLQAFLDQAPDLAGLTALRRVVCSGEALSPELAGRFFARFGSSAPELIDLYGPTEAAVEVTSHVCRPEEVRIPIGRPVANTRLHILDREGRPAPVGVHGELCLSGIQVARGYLRRPALTAGRFVPDPFAPSEAAGARLYRTGDLARWLPDGEVEYLGRLDFQVKIRGFRIELGEIESWLNAHPAVREAAVLARGEGDARRLIAWVAPAAGILPEPRELAAWLRQRLPDYMIPAVFVPLDALPLTPAGKIDRRALPDPAAERAGSATVPPRDDLERQLARLWEELLGVPSVGVRTGFFELGGHSLLAVRLMGRIRAELGRDLPLSTLFERPTIEDLARLLRGGDAPGTASPLVAIQPGGTRPPLFCIHPAGGNILVYADLARHLGEDQPVYGLEDPALRGGPALATIEEQAEAYLAALRELWPGGPYHLAGWSSGGLVAFEMARRLRAAGEEVPLVTLFDSFVFAPDDRPEPRPASSDGETDALISLGLLLPEESGLAPEERVRRAVERWHERNGEEVPADLDLERARLLLAVFRRNERAAVGYTPGPYEGRVLLFRCTEGDAGELPDAAAGWTGAAPDLEVQDVAAVHETMLREPAVRDIAARLRSGLAGAEGGLRPAGRTAASRLLSPSITQGGNP